jgi:hypothetical protein
MEGDPFEQDGLEYLFGVVYSESEAVLPLSSAERSTLAALRR